MNPEYDYLFKLLVRFASDGARARPRTTRRWPRACRCARSREASTRTCGDVEAIRVARLRARMRAGSDDRERRSGRAREDAVAG